MYVILHVKIIEMFLFGLAGNDHIIISLLNSIIDVFDNLAILNNKLLLVKSEIQNKFNKLNFIYNNL